MADRNPIRAELHYRDGRVVETNLHMSPVTAAQWRALDDGTGQVSGPTFSLNQMANGRHIYTEE